MNENVMFKMRTTTVKASRVVSFEYQSNITIREIVLEKLQHEFIGSVYNGIGVVSNILSLSLADAVEVSPDGQRYTVSVQAEIEFEIQYYLTGDIIFSADIKKNQKDPEFINIVYARGFESAIPVRIRCDENYSRANLVIRALASGLETSYLAEIAPFPNFGPIVLRKDSPPVEPLYEEMLKGLKGSKDKQKYLDPLYDLTQKQRDEALIVGLRKFFGILSDPIVVKGVKGDHDKGEVYIHIIKVSDVDKFIEGLDVPFRCVFMPEIGLHKDDVCVVVDEVFEKIEYSPDAIANWKAAVQEYLYMKQCEERTIDNVISSGTDPIVKVYEKRRSDILKLYAEGEHVVEEKQSVVPAKPVNAPPKRGRTRKA